MLIVFTGHRDRTTDPALLYALEQEYPLAVWMHGGADGFDTQVHNVAIELGKQELPALTSDRLRMFDLPQANVVVTVRPAYGLYHVKSAPILRNYAMVDKTMQGDLLVACHDGRRSGGTWDCMNYAKRKGLTVRVLEAIA